jgi:hypothetical protein
VALLKDGRELYAVMIERLGPDGQPRKGRMEHIHAHDAGEARVHFSVIYPNRRTHRIVHAALAIGFFVEDKKGEIVSAT